MKLAEFAEKYSNLEIAEKRQASEDYVELVFLNKEKDEWAKIFTEALGQAAKPAGTKPSKDDERLVDNYGGIFPNQTLFKKDFNGTTIVAMFWPWQDEVHTTLKLALINE